MVYRQTFFVKNDLDAFRCLWDSYKDLETNIMTFKNSNISMNLPTNHERERERLQGLI